jgi:hypothetical protein
MFEKSTQIFRCVILATGVMAAGVAAAEEPASPEWAVKTISALSDADLVVTSAAGKAFLEKLNPEGIAACDAPIENHPDFDKLCSWALNNEESDFDILLGIKDDKIVSFVSPFTPEKDDVWTCEPTKKDVPESDLQTCNIRSADEKSRQHWSESWESFLNSIN